MDFTDIDNYDLGEETEAEEKEDEIDVISRKYNPYTIIIQIVSQFIYEAKDEIF